MLRTFCAYRLYEIGPWYMAYFTEVGRQMFWLKKWSLNILYIFKKYSPQQEHIVFFPPVLTGQEVSAATLTLTQRTCLNNLSKHLKIIE